MLELKQFGTESLDPREFDVADQCDAFRYLSGSIYQFSYHVVFCPFQYFEIDTEVLDSCCIEGVQELQF